MGWAMDIVYNIIIDFYINNSTIIVISNLVFILLFHIYRLIESLIFPKLPEKFPHLFSN